MALRIKSAILTATEFRSDRLGVLASVAWAVDKPGRYRGLVRRGEATVAGFELEVNDTAALSQVDIDLHELSQLMGGGGRTPPHYEVRYDKAHPAYVQFFVSNGPAGYHVVVEGEAAKFDSRSLGHADIFTAVLVRPGAYVMEHQPSGARGAIDVERLKLSEKVPYDPKGTQVRVGARGLDPAKVAVRGADAVVFTSETGGAIVVRLEKPEVDKKPPPRRRNYPRAAVRPGR